MIDIISSKLLILAVVALIVVAVVIRSHQLTSGAA